MAGSLCIGIVLLATTAFADITTKSGYDQLKDAVKNTAAFGAGQNGNYTLTTTYSIKLDGNVVMTDTSTEKKDKASDTSESINTTETKDGMQYANYNYNDATCSIYKSGMDDKYYVTEYSKERVVKEDYENPFESSNAKDLEKILDAGVGNLRDYVAVEDKQDGTKELSGSINQSQIPALPNVLASYYYKQRFANNAKSVAINGGIAKNQENILANVTDDIFVKEVSGKAVVGKDGYIQSLLAEGKLSGKDKAGIMHEIEIEALVKVQDIGTTTIQKPDLSGKKVERRTENLFKNGITQKYVGTYTSNMVLLKDDAFVKVGERTVQITHIDDKTIAGKYTENVLPEYKDYQSKLTEFVFDAAIRDDNRAEFTYKDSDGAEKTGYIYFNYTCSIQLDLPTENNNSVLLNGEFDRVFEK